VVDLKQQVTNLTQQLHSLNDQVDHLSHIVSNMQMNQSTSNTTQNKKRKIESSQVGEIGLPLERQVSFSKFDFDYFMDIDKGNTSEEDFSFSNDEFEDEAAGSIAVDPNPLPNPTIVRSMESSPVPSNELAAHAVRELSTILTQLSPDLKKRFVDKLAEAIGTQLANNMTLPKAIKAEIVAEPAVRIPNDEKGSLQHVNYSSINSQFAAENEISNTLASAAFSTFFLHLLGNVNPQKVAESITITA
jgi:hypothetical protein